MSEPEVESREEWRLPQRARPPLIGELVEGIEEALATARASEAAVMTVGAAALDAAEQAKRAAEQAKRAAETAERASRAIGNGTASASRPGPGPAAGGMDSFAARADRVAERLQRLQRLPLPA